MIATTSRSSADINKAVAKHISEAKEAVATFTIKVSHKAHSQPGINSQIHGLQPIFTEAAAIIHEFPEVKSDILNTITTQLGLAYPQVREGVTDALSLLESGNDDSDIVLAPAVEGDFTIDEIFPSAMAKAINDECGKTKMRPIA